MAAPCAFEPWLEGRLEALGLDGDVYGGYIRGVLREAECDAERLEGLAGALAAGEPDEDILQDVCREIIEKWSEAQNAGAAEKKEDEVQAIASIIEKQAQIVVKPKEVSKEDTLQKAALLAQYANVTDEEDEVDVQDDAGAAAVPVSSERTLFKNTNLEDLVNARKLEREHQRDESQRKKEQDKLQREKDKLTKQERKEKEKKRTQKGERKR
ncbi:coiled-coil domain-containing protein 43 [Anolis carolinensis]|uniref:Coiled-coil domain-containing protein 43 n=1 Tax=Anolis carolinensis TaxID=28377 RepID=G1KMG5_ANOCA|nr:PREDICTED: coiled-coil domain-containing protein 43 [Anolis carolinensis]|eukprot:XP_003222560.1 PREDICTED: coiled-coil domain-containing protein 43 [Anolis carolinensis]